MGLARRGAFFFLVAAVGATTVTVSTASCTHGDYDGNFDSAGLDIFATSPDSATPLPPPVTRVVSKDQSGITTIATTDQSFEVDVPGKAFTIDVSVTITQQPDRTIGNGFIVPVYQVSFSPDATPTLPIQIVFRGNINNTNGSPGALLPVVIANDATTLPIIAGQGPQTGQSTPVWGLTKHPSATYTLAFSEKIGAGGQGQLLDPSPSNCLLNCCTIPTGGMGGGGAQLYASDVGCVCISANPNLECFKSCADIESRAQRCLDLTLPVNGSISCNMTCTAPTSACCVTKPNGLSCTGPVGNNGCSYFERCTQDSNCPTGSVCCAFDDESTCSRNCPPERHVCATTGDAGAPECDGGACNKAGVCTIRTCSATPPGCQ